MNSTAAIFDLDTLEVAQKNSTQTFFIHYSILMQNQVEIHYKQTFDTNIHKGLHYVSIVVFFTVRQKRVHAGSTIAEGNSAPLQHHMLLV